MIDSKTFTDELSVVIARIPFDDLAALKTKDPALYNALKTVTTEMLNLMERDGTLLEIQDNSQELNEKIKEWRKTN